MNFASMSFRLLHNKYVRAIPRGALGLLGFAIASAILYGAHSENRTAATDRHARCRELAPRVVAGDPKAWSEFASGLDNRPCPYALIAPKKGSKRS